MLGTNKVVVCLKWAGEQLDKGQGTCTNSSQVSMHASQGTHAVGEETGGRNERSHLH